MISEMILGLKNKPLVNQIMEIFELVYYSVASPSLKRQDVADILEISRKKNSKNHITGCMLYHNHAFLQILEGDRKVVESLYSKIELDQRHYNTRLVYSDLKTQRLFKNWSMAYVDLDKNDAAGKGESILRENFAAIASQSEHSTVASQLFWDISNQIING